MQTGVFGAAENLEVFYPIIVRLFIKVVNMLIMSQRSSQMLLHDLTMSPDEPFGTVRIFLAEEEVS